MVALLRQQQEQLGPCPWLAATDQEAQRQAEPPPPTRRVMQVKLGIGGTITRTFVDTCAPGSLLPQVIFDDLPESMVLQIRSPDPTWSPLGVGGAPLTIRCRALIRCTIGTRSQHMWFHVAEHLGGIQAIIGQDYIHKCTQRALAHHQPGRSSIQRRHGAFKELGGLRSRALEYGARCQALQAASNSGGQ